MLESFLFKVKDYRRKQGQRYKLGHILLFTILAMLSGAALIGFRTRKRSKY